MKRAGKNAIVLTAAVLYPLTSVALFFHGNWYSFFHSYSLGMFFGLVSYCYFALALTLGSRIKVLDRIFGHDRILVMHGIIACLALACGIAHAALKSFYFPEETVQSTFGEIGLGLFGFVILMTVLVMLETPLDRMPPLSRFIRFIKRRVRADYTLLKLLHNLTAPAFAIIVLHVLLASPVQETSGKTAFVSVTGLIAVLFWIRHKIARPLGSLLNAHAVAAVRPLADGIVEIELSPKRGRTIGRKAGQFAFFRFIDRACGFGEHPFTISSSPSSGTLAVTVKALGDYTAKLGSLKENALCLVDGPYGLFYPEDSDRELIFLAGGIGITPFLSILRDFADTGREGNVSLVWSVRRRDEAFAMEELRTISTGLPGFRFRVLVTGETAFDHDGPDGRIDAGVIGDALSRSSSPRAVKAFICGPDAFSRSVKNLLIGTGIPEGNIANEAFSW